MTERIEGLAREIASAMNEAYSQHYHHPAALAALSYMEKCAEEDAAKHRDKLFIQQLWGTRDWLRSFRGSP